MDGSIDTIVRGGTVVTSEATARADVAVSGGIVRAIGEHLDLTARRVIDASGLLVLPGAIDVHTHFETMVGGRPTADDFESGSRAAAAGGITCFLNFAFQEPGCGLRAAVDRELAKANGRSYVDYGLHVGVTDLSVPGVLAEVEGLADAGFTSFKIFTAVSGMELDDRAALAVFESVANSGCLVCVHAEDGALIDMLTRRLLAEGRTDVRYLNEARPAEAEALATGRMAEYARQVNCPVYFVHLSCRAALDAVRYARSKGAEVYVETRPAYLFLDRSVYERPGRDGNKFVTWPPIREVSDQRALWEGLRSGEIQTYATDHTTWLAAEKMNEGLTFAHIPGGVANVQTSTGMLYNEGVRTGRIALTQFVSVTSANPARLFGLWPRKGVLAVGSDADIMIIDPNRSFTIRSRSMLSRSDFDPYDGYEALGWPILTMVRGEVVVEDGRVVGTPGWGQPIARQRFRGPDGGPQSWSAA
jgi:dihydropyrimidinase